jgi:hypothetical protein
MRIPEVQKIFVESVKCELMSIFFGDVRTLQLLKDITAAGITIWGISNGGLGKKIGDSTFSRTSSKLC